MSSSSSQRVQRRQMLKDLRLECAICGSQIKPKEVESMGEVNLYMGLCSCGSSVQGVIGPPEVCAEFQAFMSGFAAAKGAEPPIAVLRDVPKGWYDVHGH